MGEANVPVIQTHRRTAAAATARAVRSATRAAKPRAVRGSVDTVDAFVGMLVEPHRGAPISASHGNRFFYQNDPAPTGSIRRNLGDVIAAEADLPRAAPAGYVPPASWSPRHLGRRDVRTPRGSRPAEGREEHAGPLDQACSHAFGDP